MIPNGLITQIAITALSLGIVFSYVKPTFDTIGTYQDQIGTYQAEQQKVREVNNQLSGLVSRLNSIDSESQRRLLTYLPDQVDTLAVPRTIEAVALEAGVVLGDITHEGVEQDQGDRTSQEPQYVEENTGGEALPDKEDFAVSVQGSYEQVKTFLRLLEQNEFPLEVVELEVAQTQPNLLTLGLLVRTYSHNFVSNNESAVPAADVTSMEQS